MTMLEALSAWPAATWAQHAPPPWTVVVAMLGVALVLAPRGVPGRSLGALWLLPMFCVPPERPPDGAVRITTLDVGQGLAVSVETRTHALLYDTGPRFGETSDAGGRIIAPYLRARGLRSLDAARRQPCGPRPLGRRAHAPADCPRHHALFVAAGGSSDRRARCLRRNCMALPGRSALALGRRAVRVSVTADRSIRAGRRQDQRPVVRAEDHRRRTPRAPRGRHRSAERGASCCATIRIALGADVLVVPHHGSRTSSTPAFVAAVAPRVAVFAAGYLNRFDHPRRGRGGALHAARRRADAHRSHGGGHRARSVQATSSMLPASAIGAGATGTTPAARAALSALFAQCGGNASATTPAVRGARQSRPCAGVASA